MHEKWLTYSEAAKALDIKIDSVKRRARARRWPRRTGNDGMVQVGIPADALAEDRADSLTDDPPINPPQDPPLSALVEQLNNARIEAAEHRARASALADQVADLRTERDRLLSVIERQASKPQPVSFWTRLFER